MYRFRTVQNLIGEFQELEKQQIYFAHPEQLNDPLEGMRRYYWQGDEIVWRNLLNHFILCLEHVVTLARLIDKDEKIKIEDIPVFKSIDNLPTDLYKNRIKEICNVFFANNFVQAYLNFIINNPYKIYQEEMYVHLRMLFKHAFNAIIEIDIKDGFINAPEEFDERNKNDVKIDAFYTFWDDISEKPDGKELYEELLKVLHSAIESMDFQMTLGLKESVKMQSIYVEYTKMYMEAIKKLTYPEAYLACFMDNCTNSSIWGTYGDNHRGVCLKYKIKDEHNPSLSLKTITGYSSVEGKKYNFVDFKMKKIIYQNEFDEFDFFRNLGSLPKSHLEKQWYNNEKGEYSICSDYLFFNEDEWRKNHWNQFETAYLKKLSAWSHEREYRIILSSVLDSFSNPKDRLLEYRFEDLEAIIFGMKTPKEDRIKIIDIIMDKCQKEGRGEFDFYEMTYSNTEKEMIPKKIYSVKL